MQTFFRRDRLPPPGAFYACELGKLTRPNSKGWAGTRCPFHSGRSLSFRVNLNTGAFHCFGCDARGGDIVDFVRRRDGVDFKGAAERLGAWDGRDLSMRERIEALCAANEADRLRRERIEGRAELKRKRLAVRDEIHTVAGFEREANERLSQIQSGGGEQYEGEAEDQWMLMALALDCLRALEREYDDSCEREETYKDA